MFVVRPVAAADIPALEALAGMVTPGVHTHPRSPAAIARAVERSLASFAAQPQTPGDESYMLVLEAPGGALAGSASIAATAGSRGTFFAFRNDVIQQVSRDLNVSHNVQVLTLSSDLTGHSQLSGFYVRERHRRGAEAALLARARLLFAAAVPQRFGDRFFASLSGYTDAAGRSPFWEALGRKFFQMDYLAAERLIEGARNRTLIVELMPHYPVYVPLLSDEARAVMGRVHPEGELPFAILSEEGFEPDGYIDIFDGGPILRAHKTAVHSFSGAARRAVASGPPEEAAAGHGPYLVATARAERFRATLARCARPELSENLVLPDSVRRHLDVVDGDPVLCVRL